MGIKKYEDIIAWKLSYKLCLMVYESLKTFPVEEKYSLCSQIKRSAISIPANISEGFGRFSSKDFRRFCLIAQGSFFELTTLIQLSKDLGYLIEKEYLEINILINETKKVLRSFINSIKV